MKITVGSARVDERGNYINGRPGDQTRREVVTEPYYSHRQGWFMLRAKDVQIAKKIAQAMREACANDNIGYSQSDRYGVIASLKAYGSLAKIKVKTNADCSSLVRACCIQAGISVSDFNTSSEVAVLEKTGAFDKAVAVTPSTKLQEGDILVTRTKGHTVIVTESDNKADNTNKMDGKAKKKDNLAIAKEVIAGKWGNAQERKDRLIKAGYNPLEVQAVVNKLMR